MPDAGCGSFGGSPLSVALEEDESPLLDEEDVLSSLVVLPMLELPSPLVLPSGGAWVSEPSVSLVPGSVSLPVLSLPALEAWPPELKNEESREGSGPAHAAHNANTLKTFNPCML